jgi:hypothetical protein
MVHIISTGTAFLALLKSPHVKRILILYTVLTRM